MKKKNTQLILVSDKLTKEGSISRNWCLSQYLTRVAAYINDLKNDGWEIQGKKVNGDYIYTLIKKHHVPQVKIVEKVDSSGNLRRYATYI